MCVDCAAKPQLPRSAAAFLRHEGQTCPAAFVRFGSGLRSCTGRRSLQFADRGEDGTGVTHDAGTDLDQLQMQTGQRPASHGPGQVDAAQKGGQVVGQRVQSQPDLVVAEPLA